MRAHGYRAPRAAVTARGHAGPLTRSPLDLRKKHLNSDAERAGQRRTNGRVIYRNGYTAVCRKPPDCDFDYRGEGQAAEARTPGTTGKVNASAVARRAHARAAPPRTEPQIGPGSTVTRSGVRRDSRLTSQPGSPQSPWLPARVCPPRAAVLLGFAPPRTHTTHASRHDAACTASLAPRSRPPGQQPSTTYADYSIHPCQPPPECCGCGDSPGLACSMPGCCAIMCICCICTCCICCCA